MIHIPDSIFPKDIEGNLLCPQCQKKVKECSCPSYEPAKPKVKPIKPVIRLDKSGRKGKVVTLISNLPCEESYLKNLAKTLKSKTGSGGTFYMADGEGVVEIQGDHKLVVQEFFKS
ncbi:MAG: stress response translation initiation inhibitor YciH [Candidatus Omnitrophica bacterium]|nr:stress response translation initiation inhibitor YciH [Candidatus Omnitrophota bacterium]